jgi:DNA (cytosine-5)-methyltransferase 1
MSRKPGRTKVRKAVKRPGYSFIDLFAGIGGIRIALQNAGAHCVFSSEWDKAAAATYEHAFGERPLGDITQIDSDQIPQHDILAGGFPCQAFSILGDKRGFADTRGTLFFEVERILRDKQPQALLLENVRHLVKHDSGRTFDVILTKLRGLGYRVEWRILNALDFGLPQKRERVIIVGFRSGRALEHFQWPQPTSKRAELKDLLQEDKDVDDQHWASDAVQSSVKKRLQGKPLPPKPWICHENKSGNISPLPYSCALRAGASYNYLLVNGERRLTPRENLNLQGFPPEYPLVGPASAVRRQAGNSVPVPMIEAVAKVLVEALHASAERQPRQQKPLPFTAHPNEA